MAFCPQCGKPTNEQAAQCEVCGHALPQQAKPAGGRFKGTMIMSAPTTAQADRAAPAAVAAPMSVGAVVPAAVSAPDAAPAPAASAATKPLVKGTMMGGLSAPLPTPGPKTDAFAATQPFQQSAVPAHLMVPKAEAAASPVTPASTEEPRAPRLLVGDPMAPKPSASKSGPRRAWHDGSAEQQPVWVWLAVGLTGMALIAGLGFGVAKYLGLY